MCAGVCAYVTAGTGASLDDARQLQLAQARFTVGREAPKVFTSSDSLGSRCPGPYWPEDIAWVRCRRTASCFGTIIPTT